jgi:hypothetical protein
VSSSYAPGMEMGIVDDVEGSRLSRGMSPVSSCSSS